MGVRTIVPNSISFTVELRCSSERRYRVNATLDLQERYIFMPSGIVPNLQERYIFMPSGIVPNISDVIEDFVSQLSEIASNQLALLKWDGTSDLTTEYQIIRVLPGYQVERSLMKFNIVIGNGSLIQLEELHDKTIIQL